MKRLLTILLALCTTTFLYAGNTEKEEKPDDNPTNWVTGHSIGLNLSQVGLKNWSAGGDPSISFIAYGNYHATMTKNRHVWAAVVEGEWGMLRVKGEEFRKNSDYVAAETKYGFQIDQLIQDEEGKNLPGKWYLTVLAGTKSQFSKTYTYDSDGNRDNTISRFASPITVNYSLGIDYKPNAFFSLYMSPLSAKHIIVKSDIIAAKNIHGNNGQNINSFFGASIVAKYNQQVYPKPANRIDPNEGGDANAIFLSSQLGLFRDYLAGPAENIDVDWQTTVKIKVARYISASVFMHMIWDYDVDTDSETVGIQRNLQFKNVIGVGLAYTIGGKKPNLNK